MSDSDDEIDDFPSPPSSPSPSNGYCRKAFGVPCPNISGQIKMALFHPSKPKIQLRRCLEVLGYIFSLGFEEDIDAGTMGWIHFMYKNPCPQGHAADAGLCPTPKLPRCYIHGLHPYAYVGFVEALNHYLQKENTEEIFIMRFVPVNPGDEAETSYEIPRDVWHIAELRGVNFVYAKKTLDIQEYLRYNEEFH